MNISAKIDGQSWIISLAFQQILVECIAAPEAFKSDGILADSRHGLFLYFFFRPLKTF